MAVKYLALRGFVVYLNILLRRDWRKSQDSRYLKGVWKGYMCRVIVVWVASKQRNIKYIPKLMGHANNIGDIWNLLKTKGFSPLRNIQTGSRTHTAWYSVGFGVCPVAKRSRKDVNNSPPSITEFKNEWSYTSAPHILLNGVDRDKFLIVTLILKCFTQLCCNIKTADQLHAGSNRTSILIHNLCSTDTFGLSSYFKLWDISSPG
jgi:hypothetical protein